MQPNNIPVFKEVVLAGGGHAHALVIRKWGMQPVPGVRLTLVSPDPLTPYSGMLPGLIAGHYDVDDMHIDLVKLCNWANVRFIGSAVTEVDPENRKLSLSDRPDIEYDLLSINTGSTPQYTVPGVAEFTIPIKPISGFWQNWQALQKTLLEAAKSQQVLVVGGGAGSVESVLAMAWACRKNKALTHQPDFHLVTQADDILPGYPTKVRRDATSACMQLGITLQKNFHVAEVHADKVADDNGKHLESDHVFWCIQAGAPQWPSRSGLACDDDGFIRVNRYLQSVSHEAVFATGDIAHMDENPRSKAGVYAVRQAPVLFENIRNQLLKVSLQTYKPQDKFLSLLALGGKRATGNRGWLAASGKLIWTLKDRIDRGFMDRFSELPGPASMSAAKSIPATLVPQEEKSEELDPAIRCAGCGGKVGPIVLAEVMRELDTHWQPEDASTIDWPDARLIQTTDQITAPFDDPWLSGRVSVFHALNDLLAMNATPHSLQVAVTLPFAGRTVQRRELSLLMAGIKSACRDESVILLGGHTSEGSAMSIAITANGIPGEKDFIKSGARRGDILFTNKPLGTGIVLAGHMQGLVAGRVVATTQAVMNTSNRSCSESLVQADISACTDISGFGLLGHLSEMLAGSPLKPVLEFENIPIQDGVKALSARGVHSSLLPQNEAFLLSVSWSNSFCKHKAWPILLDPQTSGGLLVTAEEGKENLLKKAGFQGIGRIV
ncbi:MAG: selenide, water dikinase SelD [Gammaproteobacteria bacterium]|nr:selenide, water dikinase SelD [Gammaproteobacteria bacterium]